MDSMKKLLGKYDNGNYTVRIFEDGTKVRKTDGNEFVPTHPESIDLKITNRCDLECDQCHEISRKDGDNGRILDLQFIRTMLPYTEIAIGGGNPLEHPRLEEFLIKCRKLDLIPNITVNQKHIIRPEYRKRLERMTEENLIFGLGVSVNSQPHKDLLKILEKFPNAVIHTINGITDDEVFTELAHHNLKILILGYKNFGRGVPYKKNNLIELYNNQEWLHDSLPEIIEQKWFDVVSFDNLAIEQLEVKNLMSAEEWDSFYMGDDGKFTMYIDAVTRTAAKSSTTPTEQRIPLEDDIEVMFKKINSNIKEN